MMRSATTLLFCGLMVWSACSNETGTLPPLPDLASEGVVLKNDKLAPEDAVGNALCEVAWSKTLPTGGSISHPALGKHDVVFVASGQKVFALGESGTVDWVWPDDDPEWDWPAGSGVPPPWELYTPALGRESALVFGTNANYVISINKNGKSRFALKTEGTVSGAPAISQEKRICIVTDEGAIYVVRDENQATLWQRVGEDKLQYPREANQPLVGPAALFGVESLLILAYDRLLCYALESGELRWEMPIPVDQEATSNAIMMLDGTIYFVVGEDRTAKEYARSYVVKVAPGGPEEGTETVLLTETQTRVVSLSQGLFDTLLAGTNNAGVYSYDIKAQTTYWHFLAGQQNFETVAQPVQAADGLIYFGAARHWLYVVSGTGDYHWHGKLETPEEDLGAILLPSSPLLLDDGLAIYHNGNLVHAVRCTDAGPTNLAWPRFGGNNANTGNIADKLIEAPTE
jgi:outer membrane protein assembly factor BamB